mmetsp:Transcript_74623/g.218598  ORF Transcript_74623/g.218598 Transcript_74623/m.218598 type:complete len:238 (-) Transcript_74623:206-919(-)
MWSCCGCAAGCSCISRRAPSCSSSLRSTASSRPCCSCSCLTLPAALFESLSTSRPSSVARFSPLSTCERQELSARPSSARSRWHHFSWTSRRAKAASIRPPCRSSSAFAERSCFSSRSWRVAIRGSSRAGEPRRGEFSRLWPSSRAWPRLRVSRVSSLFTCERTSSVTARSCPPSSARRRPACGCAASRAETRRCRSSSMPSSCRSMRLWLLEISRESLSSSVFMLERRDPPQSLSP